MSQTDKNQTTHTILGDKVTVDFGTSKYRGGIDPVFLAAFTPIQQTKNTLKILDLGCGVGTASLCLGHHLKELNIDYTLTGLDLDQASLSLAGRNYNDNHIPATLVHGDIRDKHILPLNYFDHVIMNPPFFKEDSYYHDSQTLKQSTNNEGDSGAIFDDWINCANRVLHAKGIITIVHRSDRLDDIIIALRDVNIGAIEVYPLYPYQDTHSKICLIRAQKGSRKPLTMHHGMVLHQADKKYTNKATRILYDGAMINTDVI